MQVGAQRPSAVIWLHENLPPEAPAPRIPVVGEGEGRVTGLGLGCGLR